MKYIRASDIDSSLMKTNNRGAKEAFFKGLYKELKKNVRHSPIGVDVDSLIFSGKSTQTSRNENTLGVIVESRQNPILPDVICEFSENLNIPIQLFHGSSSYDWIMQSKLKGLVEKGKLITTQLKTDTLDASNYNALLLNQTFWDVLESRGKILIFQCDAALCLNSTFTLNDFLKFDYIGSKWPNNRPVGVCIDGGNGGFSLRDWKSSVACIENFPAGHWPGAEDTFFAFHISLLGGKVANDAQCSTFSTQHSFEKHSFGCHNIARLPEAQLPRFLEYSPNAERMLNNHTF